MKTLDLKEFCALYQSCELNKGLSGDQLQAFANGMVYIIDEFTNEDVIRFYKSWGF